MSAPPLHQMTEEDYLLFEEGSEERHEFYGGEVFAMASGSVEHARVMMNTSREISQRLKGKNVKCSEAICASRSKPAAFIPILIYLSYAVI